MLFEQTSKTIYIFEYRTRKVYLELFFLPENLPENEKCHLDLFQYFWYAFSLFYILSHFLIVDLYENRLNTSISYTTLRTTSNNRTHQTIQFSESGTHTARRSLERSFRPNVINHRNIMQKNIIELALKQFSRCCLQIMRMMVTSGQYTLQLNSIYSLRCMQTGQECV